MYGRDSARKSPECQTEECGFPSVVMGNGWFLTKGKEVGRFLSPVESGVGGHKA